LFRRVPCTTNSFSVVRTTRVHSHSQTARNAIPAPTACRSTPAMEAGQPIAMSPIPTAASPRARAKEPTRTIACRRSSRQTFSQPEVTTAFAAFAERREIPGHHRRSDATARHLADGVLGLAPAAENEAAQGEAQTERAEREATDRKRLAPR